MAGKLAISEPVAQNTAIHIGSRVTVRFETGSVREFLIVDRNGSPDTGSVSSDSPLGKALLEHFSGDEVSYRVGEKQFHIRIVAITASGTDRSE